MAPSVAEWELKLGETKKRSFLARNFLGHKRAGLTKRPYHPNIAQSCNVEGNSPPPQDGDNQKEG